MNNVFCGSNCSTNERSSHPSRVQIEVLLDFLGKNRNLVKGFSKIASARDKARKNWERLAVQLNSMEGSAKSWKQWTKYWTDKKSAVKRKAALRSAALRKAGGDVEEAIELTEVEERILSLMGGEDFLQNNSLNQGSQRISVSESMNTAADSDCILKTSNSSATETYEPNFSVQTFLGSESPPRIVVAIEELEDSIDTKPSMQCDYPVQGSPPSQQRFQESPPASPLPLRNTMPRHRKRTLTSNSPPPQRPSQFSRITDRFLKLEEQRAQHSDRNIELLEAVTVIAAKQVDALNSIATLQSESMNAIAGGLHAIGEGLKMLANSCKK